MDSYAKDEEVADLHVDLFAGQVDFARQGNVCGYVFAGFDGRGNEFLVEGRLISRVSRLFEECREG